MKKDWYLGWCILAIAIFLIGCGTADSSSEAEADQKKTPPSADELLAQASTAYGKLESYSARMDLEVSVTAPGESPYVTEQSAAMAARSDPLELQAKMSTIDSDMEVYVKDGIAYYHDMLQNMWVKSDITSLSGSEAATVQVVRPIDKQIEQIQQVAEDIQVSEDDETYILNIKISEEYMKSFFNEQINNAYTNMSDDMEFDKLIYAVHIDKASHLPQYITLQMAIDASAEGESAAIDIKTDILYEDFNSIEPIQIPAEAQNAPDIADYSSSDY